MTSLMRRVAIHADTSHKYQIPLGDDGDETADDGQWFEMRPLLPNPNPPAPIRDGDTLLLPAPGAASAAATAAAARVEFRWVAPSFRATDHWSDGLATEEEKREAAERGSGFGPASETWWLCQLQGLWLSKGTARVTVIRGELDALAQRRERLAVLDGGEAAPQPAQPAQAQAQEQENHHHHAMEEVSTSSSTLWKLFSLGCVFTPMPRCVPGGAASRWQRRGGHPRRDPGGPGAHAGAGGGLGQDGDGERGEGWASGGYVLDGERQLVPRGGEAAARPLGAAPVTTARIWGRALSHN